MGSASRNNQNPQRQTVTVAQTVAYQGLLPPPDMMERYKTLDQNLPERIVKMAERSFDRADRELDIIAGAQKDDLEIMRHEAETRRIVVERGSKYDFRAQIIILFMIVILLAVTVFLALNGQEKVACFVAVGGFGAIITAAIKGVSNKTK